ncbi:FUSC family protein [Prauserella cavernicola]|uniref:FUSC family protein n=1 Tax=Prauserella cavernicola TaxID=2800127 RepID=A0A934V3H4_9PSEU|nr:aromatic acid exporter family protein [Prauserella cavernicola]MBK1783684.1 hypothetical protein [Prauserella cavernicola]
MSEHTETRPSRPQRTEVAQQGRPARVRQWTTRALGTDGHERHLVAFVLKSTIAATAAWAVSYYALDAESAAFAPFSAVLMLQVTVYQSVWHSLRYVAAVAAGVAVQLVFGFVLGAGLATFALVAVTAAVIGRWRRLGTEGAQVSTAAYFAFSTFVTAASGAERLGQLGEIIALVVLGCGIGVLVNLVVLPPLRYRSAEYGVQTLSHSLCDLISDMYPALRQGELDGERAAHWRDRASRLGPLVAQAQSSVHLARESSYYNPRRLLRRHAGHGTFHGYQAVIDALERVTYQIGSMTRSLTQCPMEDDGPEHAEFFRHYGDLLAALAHITNLFSSLDEDELEDQAPELCAAAGEAQEEHRRLAEYSDSLPLADPAQPYGILLAEATRLMEEAQYTCDVLQSAVDDARD